MQYNDMQVSQSKINQIIFFFYNSIIVMGDGWFEPEKKNKRMCQLVEL